ncbi:hypothetical protein DERP_012844, partial [Dermatophagoides pteronyssinus]
NRDILSNVGTAEYRRLLPERLDKNDSIPRLLDILWEICFNTHREQSVSNDNENDVVVGVDGATKILGGKFACTRNRFESGLEAADAVKEARRTTSSILIDVRLESKRNDGGRFGEYDDNTNWIIITSSRFKLTLAIAGINAGIIFVDNKLTKHLVYGHALSLVFLGISVRRNENRSILFILNDDDDDFIESISISAKKKRKKSGKKRSIIGLPWFGILLFFLFKKNKHTFGSALISNSCLVFVTEFDRKSSSPKIEIIWQV